MVVVVPNPNQELQIINFQKQLISRFFHNSDFICCAAPLWIPVCDSQIELKELAGTINSVTLNEIQILDSSEVNAFFTTYGQKVIGVNTVLETDKESKNIFLPLIHLSPKKSDVFFLSEENISDSIFPMKLKIFRIGKALTLSKNARALEDFIWKKIR